MCGFDYAQSQKLLTPVVQTLRLAFCRAETAMPRRLPAMRLGGCSNVNVSSALAKLLRTVWQRQEWWRYVSFDLRLHDLVETISDSLVKSAFDVSTRILVECSQSVVNQLAHVYFHVLKSLLHRGLLGIGSELCLVKLMGDDGEECWDVGYVGGRRDIALGFRQRENGTGRRMEGYQ